MSGVLFSLFILVGLIMVWIPGIDINLLKSIPRVTEKNYIKVAYSFLIFGGVLALLGSLGLTFYILSGEL